MKRRRKRAEEFTSITVTKLERWPIAIRFTGRLGGREEVTWFADDQHAVLHAELGFLLHSLITGLRPHGFSEALWGNREFGSGLFEMHVGDWFAEPGHNILPREFEDRPALLRDLLSRSPWHEIQLRPTIKMTHVSKHRYRELLKRSDEAYETLQGNHPGWFSERLPGKRSVEEVRLLRAIREPSRFLNRHAELTFVWYAQDVEAAAWCEILHAWQTRATARQCRVCGTLFLRPRAYAGKLCLTCRRLTWRQRLRVSEFPIRVRRGLVRDVAIAEQEGKEFTRWDAWNELAAKLGLASQNRNRALGQPEPALAPR